MSALTTSAPALTLSVVDGELVVTDTQDPSDPTGPGGGTTQDPMREDLKTTDVSPGLEGFLAIFAVVVVTVFLLLSMTRKLRRVAHRTGTESRVDGQFVDRAPSTASTGDVPGTPGAPDDDSARGA